MKLYAYKAAKGTVRGDLGIVDLTTVSSYDPQSFLGAVELTEPPKPKQTVTKEAGWIMEPKLTESGNQIIKCHIPVNAKNIRCTYEVEE